MEKAKHIIIISVFIFILACSSHKTIPKEFSDDTYITHLKKDDSLNISASVYYFTPDIKFRTDHRYYWLDKDSIIQTYSNFSGKLLHGPYEEFYPNDQLYIKGQFKNGLKTGKWYYWDKGGVLKRTEEWALWGKKIKTKTFGSSPNEILNENKSVDSNTLLKNSKVPIDTITQQSNPSLIPNPASDPQNYYPEQNISPSKERVIIIENNNTDRNHNEEFKDSDPNVIIIPERENEDLYNEPILIPDQPINTEYEGDPALIPEFESTPNDPVNFEYDQPIEQDSIHLNSDPLTSPEINPDYDDPVAFPENPEQELEPEPTIIDYENNDSTIYLNAPSNP